MILKKDPIASLQNLTEEKIKFTDFLKQRENDCWTKKWQDFYLLHSILRQKNWVKPRRIRRFSEMIHEYQRRVESSRMPGAGTEYKTYLESHGWNFCFPTHEWPSLLGNTVQLNELSKI